MKASFDRISIITAYFLIYVVWGSTYFFIGMALEGFPTFLLGALRFSIAGMILLFLCQMRGEKIFRISQIGHSAISGIVLLFVDMAVIMLAQRYVSSSLVAIVASSTAIWIMLFDIPMWKKNLSNARTIAGLILGFFGVGMLYIEQLGAEHSESSHPEYGILILIIGCVSWALGTLFTKYRSPKEERTGGFVDSAWQMLFAGSAFWICTGLFENFPKESVESVPITAWWSLLYLIVFGSLLAYSAYIWLLKIRPATEVATHAYVNPVVAVILGGSLGNETVTVLQLTGLTIILISVLMVNKK